MAVCILEGRAGTPLRIGGYMGHDVQKACAGDPALLAAQFDQIGFSAYDSEMLAQCCTLLSVAPTVDFQFDIMPDGSLSNVFGLSLSFNETVPRAARACMQDGYGAQICTTFQEWGLADDRWKCIADAAFARHVPFSREDGTQGRFALCCLFNYAKVKFADAVAKPAKFYLRLFAGDSAKLKEDLREVGCTVSGTEILRVATQIAISPFDMELQFDVLANGILGNTIGLSAGFPFVSASAARPLWKAGGTAAQLMQFAEELGIADGRWQHVPDALFTTAVPDDDALRALYCIPVFVKFRVREGAPLDTKVYLQAGTRNL